MTPEGRPLHPSGWGGWTAGPGGHRGQCSSGGRWLPGAGGAAHPAARGTFTGRRADNGPGKGLIATRRPSPSAAGRRTVRPWAPGRPPRPPAAPPLPPALPPRDPVASRRGAAGGKAWRGGRCSDTCGRARENKGGMCAAWSQETGRRWGPGARTAASQSLLFAGRTSTRA